MRNLILIALLAFCLQTSQQFHIEPELLETFKEAGWNLVKNHFGHFTGIIENEDLIEHLIVEGMDIYTNLMTSPSHYEDFIKRITSYTKEDMEQTILTCSKGDKPNFWKFASWPVGEIGKNMNNQGNQTITLDSRPDDCFAKVELDLDFIESDSLRVTFRPQGEPKTPGCSDSYVLATYAEFQRAIHVSKETTVTIMKVAANKLKALNLYGLHVYRACDEWANVMPDVMMTVALFLGGLGSNPDIPVFGSHPTWWQETLNPAFIQQGTGFQWRQRKDVFVDLDEHEVRNGDFLCITRMDGLDQIIQWGAGSICGHSVVMLEFDGEMYAIESQDGWYWPKRNIQRNPWKQWKQWAKNAGFNVAVLPMRDDIRAKLNVTKAAEFFRSVEGMPYGYHNFIFGWLDIPSKNVPPVTTIDFLYTIFAMLERIYPPAVVSIMGEAVNKRMNTTGLSLEQLGNLMALRNLTIEEVFSMVEQDDWMYSDGYSMVCSSFVIAIYKAGGLFGDLSIQATEFTPRDIYQLNFWDVGYKPEKCKGVDNDLPYCQIMGKHKIDVFKDKYNTINPYDHMFEKCPSEPPLFERPSDC